MKILIVKLGSIGDIVHALPALAAIRRSLPDAEITWVAEERSAEIIRQNPMIDNLVEVNTRAIRPGSGADSIIGELRRQVRGVRSHQYDVALDLQGLLKSAAIAKISGAAKRVGFERPQLREPISRVFLTDTVAVEPHIHVIRKNLRLAGGALGIPVDDHQLEFPIAADAGHIAESEALCDLAGGRFAILNPAGGWVTKLWPAENFGRLADRIWNELGIVPIVTTGPGDIELAEIVSKNSLSGKTIYARPSLKGFYELAKRATLYVGGDTGPTHIAFAAGAPIVGLFGPTEWWRNGSLDPSDICVERTDIACRINCHRRTCSNWICMDIDVDTAFQAVKQRIGSQNL
jgi:lipopolysaccharide heptosyltransferase I